MNGCLNVYLNFYRKLGKQTNKETKKKKLCVHYDRLKKEIFGSELSLGQEDLLKKEMATHPSILAWRIPWTEEPGRLQGVHGVTQSQTQLND